MPDALEGGDVLPIRVPGGRVANEHVERPAGVGYLIGAVAAPNGREARGLNASRYFERSRCRGRKERRPGAEAWTGAGRLGWGLTGAPGVEAEHVEGSPATGEQHGAV